MLTRAAIYLDSNAGAPLKPSAQEALLLFLQGSGGLIANPSSTHSHGRQARRAFAEARAQVARSLRTSPEQIVFTSSGTESNQIAIRSVLESKISRGERPHWITTQADHDSSHQMVSWLRDRGGNVSFLPISSEGMPQIDLLPGLLQSDTALISLTWVNNETGVIADVHRLAEMTRARGIPLHIDGAQAWGKLPIDLDRLGAQFVTFSGHKIGGLAGTGVLFLGKGVELKTY
jgi:cysteine desulfurase